MAGPAPRQRVLVRRWWVVAAACLAGGILFALSGETIIQSVIADTETDGFALATALAILFFYFFASQLVMAPSGTISILLTGAVFGIGAGIVYFIAMIAACAVVHVMGRLDTRSARRLVCKVVRVRSLRGFVLGLMSRIRTAPIASTAAIRLVPVVPSAGCALLVAAAGASLGAALLGTLATGWVRPIVIAAFSDQVWRAIESGERGVTVLVSNPLVWISLVCAALSALVIFAIGRAAQWRAAACNARLRLRGWFAR